jgi:sucrose-6-phosphate hydrolase SacC (GH32 family)
LQSSGWLAGWQARLEHDCNPNCWSSPVRLPREEAPPAAAAATSGLIDKPFSLLKSLEDENTSTRKLMTSPKKHLQQQQEEKEYIH